MGMNLRFAVRDESCCILNSDDTQVFERNVSIPVFLQIITFRRPSAENAAALNGRDRSPDAQARLNGVHLLLEWLLYGTGLRISEALQLRESKGGKDRVVMLPQAHVAALREQLTRGRAVWSMDVAANQAGVAMPYALERNSAKPSVS